MRLKQLPPAVTCGGELLVAGQAVAGQITAGSLAHGGGLGLGQARGVHGAQHPSKPHRSNMSKKTTTPRSLTEVETRTRNDPEILIPTADGHAGQQDEDWWLATERLLPEFEERARGMRDREAEELYVRGFMSLFHQHGSGDQNYKLLPNASLAIDVVMTLCARRGWRVQLLEPCFDNLYLYAKERRVPVQHLPEERLRDRGAYAVGGAGVDLAFLVAPNNPTGYTLDAEAMSMIAELCARNRITLAIDASFRAYDKSRADHYAIVKEAGCSWIIIEDSGKTWPTSERKASILSCSNDLKKDINEICEMHVLGWSTPILLMLSHLVGVFEAIGIERALHLRVRWAREIVRQAVSGTFVRPAPSTLESCLPVEWLEILDDRYDDLAVTSQLAKRGLAVLPGRHFFFSRLQGEKAATNFIRISLLKQRHILLAGARVLRNGLLEIAPNGATPRPFSPGELHTF